jgi:hypothetical protein
MYNYGAIIKIYLPEFKKPRIEKILADNYYANKFKPAHTLNKI